MQAIRHRRGSVDGETDSDCSFTVTSEDSSDEEFMNTEPTTSRTPYKRNRVCPGNLPLSPKSKKSNVNTVKQNEQPQCERGNFY